MILAMNLLRYQTKRHELDPYQYYVKVIEAIPYCETADYYEVLLPWIICLPKIGTVELAA